MSRLVGSAPHNGGSCQLSLSYDNGASFKVIKSIIGNCPVQTSWDFTVPTSVPTGEDVLFAWSWINKTGNREMYMNCARVNIENDDYAASETSFESLPAMFRANIFSDTCLVDENVDVVYPNPGEQVEYGVASLRGTAATEVLGCPADSGSEVVISSKSVTSTESTATTMSSLSSAEESSKVEDPEIVVTADQTTVVEDRTTADLATPTSTVIYTPSTMTTRTRAYTTAITTSPAVTPITEYAPAPTVTRTATYVSTPTVISASGKCTPNTMLCSDDGASFSVCDHDAWVPMGAVASGTTCSNGKIVRYSALGACTVDGETKCLENGTKWATCAQGAWIDMGAVAAGISCSSY